MKGVDRLVKYMKFLYIVIGLQAILICYLILNSFAISDSKNEGNKSVNENMYSIYVEDELFTFRNKEGKRLPTIEYNNNIYIPLSAKGLFLNYYVEVEKNNVYLKSGENSVSDYIDINCETINGSTFTNDDLLGYDYTVVLNWSTWCPDCDDILKSLTKTLNQFENGNVQFLGLLMDDTEDINIVRENVSNKLNEYGLDFVNIVPNKSIENDLQTNVSSIPNFYILDSKGRLVANDVFEIEDLLDNLKELKENACNEC